KAEVYVAPFPGPGAKRQVSIGGGFSARWRPDGKELFYNPPDGGLMAAQIEGKGRTLEVGKVVRLFARVNGLSGDYDVSTDGQRFLAALPPEGDIGPPLT